MAGRARRGVPVGLALTFEHPHERLHQDNQSGVCRLGLPKYPHDESDNASTEQFGVPAHHQAVGEGGFAWQFFY
jgi:hypothetical protein